MILIFPRASIYLVTLMVLGGCASLVNDGQQTITVRTDCKEIVLKQSCSATLGNKHFSFITPAKLTLPRTSEPLIVNCQGVMFGGAGFDVPAGLSAGMLGNVVAGGAVGMVIDLNTKRGFAHPNVTNLVMPICQFYK